MRKLVNTVSLLASTFFLFRIFDHKRKEGNDFRDLNTLEKKLLDELAEIKKSFCLNNDSNISKADLRDFNEDIIQNVGSILDSKEFKSDGFSALKERIIGNFLLEIIRNKDDSEKLKEAINKYEEDINKIPEFSYRESNGLELNYF